MSNGSDYFILGVDFGTSCTKVIGRAPFVQNGDAVAIPFNCHPLSSFFLPSLIFFGTRGQFELLKEPGFLPFRNLKASLMTAPDVVNPNLADYGTYVTPRVAAVCFLARVIGQSLNILRVARPKWFANNLPDCSFHLGIPSKTYDEPGIHQTFQEVAKAAWKVATTGINTLGGASEIAEAARASSFDPGVHPDSIQVVPELVAQTAGYIESRTGQECLHLLIDVGASTLDVASFTYYRDRKERKAFQPLFSAEVELLGTSILHQSRKRIIADSHPSAAKTLPFDEDPMQPVPDSYEMYGTFSPAVMLKLKENEDGFLKKCKTVLTKTYSVMKRKDPMSKVWRQGVPYFFCGGGAKSLIYQKARNELDKYLKEVGNCPGLLPESLELTIPVDLKIHKSETRNYDRLSVAYGLTYPHYQLSQFCPPREVDEIHPSELIQVSARRRVINEYNSNDNG